MSRVDFDQVEKRYPGDVQAISDCTLRVADGELLVLVGPSGCGKSTLLRLLAGLETVTSGTIRIADRVVNDVPPQARNVAMVFQDYALYPHMSARANLEFPLKMRRLSRSERAKRIDAVATGLAITSLLDRLPKQLSGGQRQRVAMGRALVRDPSVFLLDEPLSNLDAKLRVQVRADIKDLQQRTCTTMLYVTHDQVEAMTLGDRVAVLHDGRLQQVAPPAELYAHPSNLVVAGFIGNPPMNLFPTEVATAADGRLQIRIGTQFVPLADKRIDRERLHRESSGAIVTAGIRPEALRLSAASADPWVVSAMVAHVEYLGHETLVYLRIEGPARPPADAPLIARSTGMHRFTRGEPVALRIDPEQLYFFDAEGRALEPGAGNWRTPAGDRLPVTP